MDNRTHSYLYEKKQYQTLDPNSLDYKNRPESPRIGAVQWPKFWGKIARILNLVQWLLVGSGLLTKITMKITVVI